MVELLGRRQKRRLLRPERRLPCAGQQRTQVSVKKYIIFGSGSEKCLLRQIVPYIRVANIRATYIRMSLISEVYCAVKPIHVRLLQCRSTSDYNFGSSPILTSHLLITSDCPFYLSLLYPRPIHFTIYVCNAFVIYFNIYFSI